MLRKLVFTVAVVGLLAGVGVVSAASAVVVVQVPADARVYFDNQPTKQAGEMRTFSTPDLPAGKAFFYEVRADVMRDGKVTAQTRRVAVRAGQTTRVDLRSEDAAGLGYLYTLNNDKERNGLIVLRRQPDGALEEVAGSPVATGGKGLLAATSTSRGPCASTASTSWP